MIEGRMGVHSALAGPLSWRQPSRVLFKSGLVRNDHRRPFHSTITRFVFCTHPNQVAASVDIVASARRLQEDGEAVITCRVGHDASGQLQLTVFIEYVILDAPCDEPGTSIFYNAANDH